MAEKPRTINELAQTAQLSRSCAETTRGYKRLEHASVGLAAAEEIKTQTSGMRDHEGHENLITLLARLRALRQTGVAETRVALQKLLELATASTTELKKRAEAVAAIETILTKYPLDFPEALEIRRRIAQLPPAP